MSDAALERLENIYGTTGAADGTSTGVDSAEIDMSNCESAVAILPVTNSTAAATVTLSARGSTASGGTFAAISGATVTSTTGPAGRFVQLELKNNSGYRYVQFRQVQSAANTTLGPMLIQKHNLAVAPSTHGSTSVNASQIATT